MEAAVREFGRDEFTTGGPGTGLASRTRYVSIEFADEESQDRVIRDLSDLDQEFGTRKNRVYYLAVPPEAMPRLVEEIGERRAAAGWTRLIVEKPFGHDLESARELNELLAHGTSPRTRSSASTTTWARTPSRTCSRCASPTASSSRSGTGSSSTTSRSRSPSRSGSRTVPRSTSRAGAIRDVFQNHLLQLVALTGMEPPIDFTAEAVRNEKLKVLKALATPAPNEVVRGQYGPGFIEGEPVPGYREEPKVDPDSETETFVAARLEIENWRWADTPFYVRVGKRLPRRETTIAVEFKRVPHPLFEDARELRPNILIVHIQPNEGVSLAIGAKVPGEGMRVRTVHMDFLYGGAFRTGLPEAYERLILDAMLGDATLFTRSDEIEEQWALVDAIVAAWRRDTPSFPNYPAGTWGPQAAQELVEWHR